ncbi:Phomenoic acid biosynthesis cluster-specific transcriptional regulator [Paramyrothecium foliicola]|nr:Phomenoic acid biosynthesis cluster-specific transcriptional regulator [Paramyrothecium foliicola]
MPPASAAAGGDAPRQCWECLRRRWVCDAARPVCNKCRAAGIVCPGYNDRKPLTWLAPGRVTSRARRQNPKQGQRGQTGDSTGEDVGIKLGKGKKSAARKAGPDSLLASCSLPAASTELPPIVGTDSSSNHSATNSSHEAFTGIVPESLPGNHPQIADTADLAEAARYYNAYIYPSLITCQLAPNPFVAPVSSVECIPPSLGHALVSMTLRHRILQHNINRRPNSSSRSSPSSDSPSPPSSPPSLLGSSGTSYGSETTNRNSPSSSTSAPASNANPAPCAEEPLADMWMQLHRHTGLGIRALNEEISEESTRSSDATITSVSTFLTAELTHSVSPLWRPHADGLLALITLRGGLGKLTESAEHLKPALLSFVIVSALANTTSPPTDQIMIGSHEELMGVIPELYNTGVFPALPCPLPLFINIININRMRHQLATEPPLPLSSKTQAAAIIMRHINEFIPEIWAQSQGKSHLKEWYLIARIFQSAVWLYCTAALTSTAEILSDSRISTDSSIDHRTRLFALLLEAMESPVVKRGVVWPLVVAGFEAATGTSEERSFVNEHLFQIMRDTGASYPLVAKGALEKFWTSGKTLWDDCFDHPYAVLT